MLDVISLLPDNCSGLTGAPSAAGEVTLSSGEVPAIEFSRGDVTLSILMGISVVTMRELSRGDSSLVSPLTRRGAKATLGWKVRSNRSHSDSRTTLSGFWRMGGSWLR